MVAYMGFEKATRMILERGEPLKAHLNVKDKNNRTPLHLASQCGHYDIAGLLLKFGADVDAQDSDAMTPLLLVSQRRRRDSQITKTAQVLLEHRASVHVRNKVGQVPLHMASHLGLSGIVALLLKFGAYVDAQDNNNMTPLHLVSQPLIFGNDPQITKTAQLLLEHGASLYVRDKNGQMALHAASRHHLCVIIALLLKFGADVDAQDNDSMTPLLLVSQSQMELIYPEYLSRPRDDSKFTKAAQVLLEHRASTHVRNKNGQMPLHLALHNGLSGVVALLLKFSSDVDAQDNDAMTPLHVVSQSRFIFGVESRFTKTIQLLLEHGASVHIRNKDGQMPLHTASYRGLGVMVALLLNSGGDVDAQDNDAMTPLHLVFQRQPFVGNDDAETVRVLLEHGASVHIRNKNGKLPLHTASHHCLPRIVALLLECGADADAQDNDAMTPLHLVSRYRSENNHKVTKTAQLLLEHGANVHMRNKNGQMPLHLASQHVIPRIVEFFLKLGADVDARDSSNSTPLHWAVSSPFQRGFSRPPLGVVDGPPMLWRVIKTIKQLLEHGAKPQIQNDKGETPLQVALARGEQEIIDLLSHDVQNDLRNAVRITGSIPFETTH